MKRTIKVLGVIAIVAIIGFSMAACDNGSTASEGTITIKDIPAIYNGKYALFFIRVPPIGETRIWGVQGWNNDGSMILTKINNGKAVIPLHDVNTGDTYKGNDTFVQDWETTRAAVCGSIWETATITNSDLEGPRLLNFWFSSVTFSNGSATKSWNDRL
jgi:hypothetical protein